MSVRLDKYISEYANLTRSESKEALKKGKVTLNGVMIKDGSQKIELSDVICLNGVEIIADTGFHYYVMNKPAGVITATKDQKDTCVLDLLPKEFRKNLSPVGRLDKDTTGLLVLTDDGAMLHRLLSPKFHVDKTYVAKVLNDISDDDVALFEAGLDIGDDKKTLPASLQLIDRNTAMVTICEGRFHQVKRMFHAIHNEVLELKRISMGDFHLPSDLAEGQFREMTDLEVLQLNVSK